MSDRRCPECQSPLGSGALDGLCPRCLAGLLFDPGPEPDSGEDSGVVLRVAPLMPTRSVLLELPGYEVMRELARGGMGIVYQATQLEPRREVALKMLLPHQVEAEEFRERFMLEARAIARLEHPHILPVYQVGEHDGVPYFTMKLAGGGSLADRRSRYRRSWRDIAELVATLADAVQYAHERGVLHRDLKPGNVLFDDKGRPYVSDFGLAKLADDTMPEEEPGQVIGTPRYVAPEVAGQGSEMATVASDIYGLGVILYELLAQKAPFAALSQQALLRMVADAPPHAPGVELRGVPHELDILCMRCLEKDPVRRFPTAGKLSEELTRWLRGEPVESLPATRREQFRRWVRQQRAVVGLTLAIAVLGLALVVGSVWAAFSLAASRRAVVEERDRARGDLVQARLGEARGLRLSGQIRVREPALKLLSAAAQVDPQLELRNEAAAVLGRWEVGPEEARHRFGGEGLPLALSTSLDLVADADRSGGVRIWRRVTGAVMWQDRGTNAGVPDLLRFSSGGRWLAVGGRGGVRVVDVTAASVVLDRPGRWLGFSSDERLVVLEGDGSRIEMREPGTGRVVVSWAFPPGIRNGLAVSQSSGIPRVLVQGADHLSILDGETGGSLYRLPFHRGEVRSVVWHDAWVVAGDHTGGLRTWNLRGVRLRDLAGHRAAISRLVLSPDGTRLWSVSEDGESRMWEMGTGQPMGRTGLWQPLCFGGDGMKLVYTDGPFFGMASMQAPMASRTVALGGAGRVRHLAFSPDGVWIAAVDAEGLFLMDPRSGRVMDRAEVPGAVATHFAPEGANLFVVHRTGVRAFRIVHEGRGVRLESGEETRSTEPLWFTGATLLGGGRSMLVTARNGRVEQFDLVQGRWGTVVGQVEGVRSATMDSERKWLALDLGEGRTVVRSVGEGGVVWSSDAGSGVPGFSPDGRHLLLAGGEWHRILDTTEWKPRLAWETGAGSLSPGSGQWSRFGRAFAASSPRSGIQVGSTENWKPVIRLTPSSPVTSLALGPDGRDLAAGTDEDQVILWSLQELRQVLGSQALAWTEAIFLQGVPPNPNQGLVARSAPGLPVECIGIRPRDPKARSEVIDLGGVLNESFDEPDFRYTAPRERPVNFPLGRVQLAGSEFDFRGFVRVGGGTGSAGDRLWPSATRPVAVGSRVNGLIHVGALLPGSGSATLGDGIRMRVQWSDGKTGEWGMAEDSDGLGPWYAEAESRAEAGLVWEGISEVSEKRQSVVRLYRYRWVNPRPEVVVDSVSWVSGKSGSGVRIVGLTRY